jgi:hypothetical protein
MTKNISTPHPFDQLKQKEITTQAKKLEQHPFWWVHENGQSEASMLFDAKSKNLYPAGNDPISLVAQFNKESHAFWWLGESKKGIIFDKQTKLLWLVLDRSSTQSVAQANEKLKTVKTEGLTWQLPTHVELKTFATKNNPWREGQDFRLFGRCYWLCTEGRTNTDANYWGVDTSSSGFTIAVSKALQNKSVKAVIAFLAEKNIFLKAYKTSLVLKPDINTTWQNKTHEQIFLELQKKGWMLKAHYAETTIAPASVMDMLKEMDYRSVRLPKLESAQFTDINKGMWEFWGMDEARLKSEGIVARDPAKDVKKYNVAFDFGTSSTVVAVDNNGTHELFRIGVRDFFEAAKSAHYENPTVLEFIDYPAFLDAWQTGAYRPEVNWNDVKCSHEAQHNFRNNQSNAQLVSSIFPKMKQWAMRQADEKIKLIDQSNRHEIELAPLALKNPVKGQLLTVGTQDSFDPIELYAWFLGMTINWRSRGIFLKYYMTFPVAYAKEVKEKILASFRRGLMRSMPASLVTQDIFQKNFSLEELATEPAAYAASALKVLNIEPTTEGVAYAVFDFGGGTTDFDYGFYRWATPEEEEQGSEIMLEHVDAQGDKFLGGENLLENMAYLVFQHNIDICRNEKIAFTKPLDAKAFAGSELFLDKTQAAQTNSVMLMAKLRSFWETGEYTKSSDTGVEKIEFLNRDGEKKECDFAFPIDDLEEYLTERIEEGIENFFMGMKAAFGNTMPEQVHILLAGNSSRSRWVADFFDDYEDETPSSNNTAKKEPSDFEAMVNRVFGAQAPKFVVHPPLEADDDNPYSPTAKTGVALGLLQLCPGGQIDLVNKKAAGTDGDEAPFGHFVGRLRQGKLQVALQRSQSYHQWHELTPINRGVANLYHTQAPRALSGEMREGDSEMTKVRLDFVGDTTGHKAFVRAIAPNAVEICSSESMQHLEKGEYDNLQTVNLG